jgi:excinuclease ABC subunit C
MMELAQNMHFEEAQKIKEKIEVLENYQSRSTINPKSPISMFSIVSDESAAYVNFYKFTWFYYPLTYYGNKETGGNRC